MSSVAQPSTTGLEDKKTSGPLSKKIKIITHLVSLLIPAVLIVQLILLLSTPPSQTLVYLVSFLGFTLYIAGYGAFLYFLAGGFDWKNENLSLFRVVLFWVIGAILYAYIFYFFWYLTRLIVAKIYHVPLSEMLGRLLATNKKAALLESIAVSDIGPSCENCGTKTSIGKSYTFVCGDQIGQSVSFSPAGAGIYKTTTTRYRTSESVPVYLCNKCVSLKKQRETAKFYNIALIVLIGALAIAIPLGIFIDNPGYYMLPAMILFSGSPFYLLQSRRLIDAEGNPLQAYANIHLSTEGEQLAIKLKRFSLARIGIDAFFTHEEAKSRLKPA